jgi:type IV pilus biogenesis protein PilP
MSKVINTIIVAVMLVGFPCVGMSAGNSDNVMGSLEEFRAKTALAEAQIIYLEKAQKLKDLQSGKRSESSEFKSKSTEPVSTTQVTIPPMTIPPMDISPSMNTSQMNPMEMFPVQSKPTAPAVVYDEVLGVMGIDGKYTATIKTETGIFQVSKGDKLSNGVIASISLDKVVLKKANKEVSLPFAE